MLIESNRSRRRRRTPITETGARPKCYVLVLNGTVYRVRSKERLFRAHRLARTQGFRLHVITPPGCPLTPDSTTWLVHNSWVPNQPRSTDRTNSWKFGSINEYPHTRRVYQTRERERCSSNLGPSRNLCSTAVDCRQSFAHDSHPRLRLRQYSHSGDHTLQATDRAIKDGGSRALANWAKLFGEGERERERETQRNKTRQSKENPNPNSSQTEPNQATCPKATIESQH